MKKKIILMLCMALFVACMLAISVSAVNVDGIEYSFKGTEATVTNGNKSCQLTVVNIPETVTYEEVTYTVAYIADSAFRGNGVVTELTTPSTIKSIGEHAFREMSVLKKITLNASPDLKYVNNAEVYGCKSLEYADLSGMVGLIDMGKGSTYDHTFTNCSKLTKVVLPESLEVIGTSAFNGCSSLVDINFPSKLTTIRSSAFTSCALDKVELPATVNYIGDYAFQSCKNLTSLNIPMGVTYLGCNNFQYTKVEKVVIPSTVVTATKDMFNSVTTINVVVIGNSDVSGYTGSVLSNCGPLNYVFYAGTDVDGLKSKFSSIKNHAVVSFEQYLLDIANPDFKGYTKTIIYGTKNCKSCGDIFTAETEFLFTNVLENMYMGAECEFCGAAEIEETFAPVFTDLGYTSANINGVCSMARGYRINYTSMNKYNEMFPQEAIGEFGVFAVATSKLVDGTAFDENGNSREGVLSSAIKSGFEYFDMKVTYADATATLPDGTPYVDALVSIGAYVFIGGEIHYIKDGVSVTVDGGDSFNSIQ